VAGGWRIYSSGPGITLRILVQDLLGWRIHRDEIVLDPLLPTGQDRLDYSVDGLGGSTLDVHVQIDGCQPDARRGPVERATARAVVRCPASDGDPLRTDRRAAAQRSAGARPLP
jgi:hypothetical protein